MTVDNKPKLYLGIQDGLIEIEPESRHIDTIPSFNDKYITKFYQQSKDNNLYLTTLNHGIFYGRSPIANMSLSALASIALPPSFISRELPASTIICGGNSLVIAMLRMFSMPSKITSLGLMTVDNKPKSYTLCPSSASVSM